MTDETFIESIDPDVEFENTGQAMSYSPGIGCTNATCRRAPGGECVGFHCANCHQPSSYQGHFQLDGTFSCEAADD